MNSGVASMAGSSQLLGDVVLMEGEANVPSSDPVNDAGGCGGGEGGDGGGGDGGQGVKRGRGQGGDAPKRGRSLSRGGGRDGVRSTSRTRLDSLAVVKKHLWWGFNSVKTTSGELKLQCKGKDCRALLLHRVQSGRTHVKSCEPVRRLRDAVQRRENERSVGLGVATRAAPEAPRVAPEAPAAPSAAGHPPAAEAARPPAAAPIALPLPHEPAAAAPSKQTKILHYMNAKLDPTEAKERLLLMVSARSVQITLN